MTSTQNQKYVESSFHGGRFWEAIGPDLCHLEKAASVIPADVLDAWFDPAPGVVEALREQLPFLMRTSPPVDSAGLRQVLARCRHIHEECILAGGGSSDLLFTCLPHLIDSEYSAMILDPAYGEYAHIIGGVQGAGVKRFRLRREDGFRIDAEALMRAVLQERVRMVAIVNPNSPTGVYWPAAQARALLEHIPRDVTVVVDDTYIDYVSGGESLEREATGRPNLIIIKSLSKAYALSGLRVGYLVAHSDMCRGLKRFVPPWAVSLPAQFAAIRALQECAYYERRWRETNELRQEFAAALGRMPGVKVYSGCANFVLLELEADAGRVLERLRAKNIYVRNCDSMSEQFCGRFLRVAVRGRNENLRVCEALNALDAPCPSVKR
jgi:histidinol-phosphate/aromatic aminotransferase/cobyric acid decarboxylase-like protein